MFTHNTNEWIIKIAWGKNLYIAITGQGTVVTSKDGAAWSITSLTPNKRPLSVFYLNNQFLVHYNDGMIAVSADGTTWTSGSGVTDAMLTGFTWGNNQFIGIGSSGSIVISTDGNTWSTKTYDLDNWFNFESIVWGNNQFVAVAKDQICNSSDGINWTRSLFYFYPEREKAFRYVTLCKDIFVALTLGYAIKTSTDGTTWTSTWSEKKNTCYSAASNDSLVVVVGDGGTIVTAPDAMNWTPQTYRIGNPVYRLHHY